MKKKGCHGNLCACKYDLLWHPTCKKKTMVVLATQKVYKMGYKEAMSMGIVMTTLVCVNVGCYDSHECVYM